MMTESEASAAPLPRERILLAIHVVRGHRVMLDADLAALYGVETKALNQAVKRNIARFPEDFAFQLTDDELANLTSQIVTSKRGGRRYPPYAFTEQGVAMLSSVLRSPRAVQVNIEIMRTFVHLRQALAGHEDLSRKLDALEARYDRQFGAVFDAIRQLVGLDRRSRRRRGFFLAAQPHG
jgi:hypothetical protein